MSRSRRETSRFLNVGSWTLQKKLGRGSFGAVHVAQHMITSTKVAMKMMQINNDHDLEDFDRECDVMRALAGHPNVVTILGVEITNDTHCLLMELGACDLATHCKKVGRLLPIVVKSFTKQLLEAVAHIHSFNIVHNDMKLENVILDKSKTIVKVADFGISRPLAKGNSCFTGYCGTLAYAAPEVLSERGYGHAIDVWALGVCVYFMIRAQMPFRDDSLGVLKSDMLCHKYDTDDFGAIGEKQIMEQIFEVDQAKRPSAATLLLHPWLNIHERRSASILDESSASNLNKTVTPTTSGSWNQHPLLPPMRCASEPLGLDVSSYIIPTTTAACTSTATTTTATTTTSTPTTNTTTNTATATTSTTTATTTATTLTATTSVTNATATTSNPDVTQSNNANMNIGSNNTNTNMNTNTNTSTNTTTNTSITSYSNNTTSRGFRKPGLHKLIAKSFTTLDPETSTDFDFEQQQQQQHEQQQQQHHHHQHQQHHHQQQQQQQHHHQQQHQQHQQQQHHHHHQHQQQQPRSRSETSQASHIETRIHESYSGNGGNGSGGVNCSGGGSARVARSGSGIRSSPNCDSYSNSNSNSNSNNSTSISNSNSNNNRNSNSTGGVLLPPTDEPNVIMHRLRSPVTTTTTSSTTTPSTTTTTSSSTTPSSTSSPNSTPTLTSTTTSLSMPTTSTTTLPSTSISSSSTTPLLTTTTTTAAALATTTTTPTPSTTTTPPTTTTPLTTTTTTPVTAQDRDLRRDSGHSLGYGSTVVRRRRNNSIPAFDTEGLSHVAVALLAPVKHRSRSSDSHSGSVSSLSGSMSSTLAHDTTFNTAGEIDPPSSGLYSTMPSPTTSRTKREGESTSQLRRSQLLSCSLPSLSQTLATLTTNTSSPTTSLTSTTSSTPTTTTHLSGHASPPPSSSRESQRTRKHLSRTRSAGDLGIPFNVSHPPLPKISTLVVSTNPYNNDDNDNDNDDKERNDDSFYDNDDNERNYERNDDDNADDYNTTSTTLTPFPTTPPHNRKQLSAHSDRSALSFKMSKTNTALEILERAHRIAVAAEAAENELDSDVPTTLHPQITEKKSRNRKLKKSPTKKSRLSLKLGGPVLPRRPKSRTGKNNTKRASDPKI